PRLDPIVLESPPDDPDAACVRAGDRLSCGGTLYGLDGRLLPDESTQPDMGGAKGEPDAGATDLGPDDAPGLGDVAASAPGVDRRQQDCRQIADQIVCDDGLVGRAPEGAGDPGALERCTSERLPGLGRRIVCAQGAGVVRITPDGVGESPPACAQVGASITCDDGTAYLDPPGGEGPLQGGAVRCERVRVQPGAPPDVVARCARELDCPEAGCGLATGEAPPGCERALNPTLVCDTGTMELELEPPAPCHAPSSGIVIDSPAAARDLQELGCAAIFGDVRIEATGGAPPDLRGALGALAGTLAIRGSLEVVGATLPRGEESGEEFFDITTGLALRVVSGSVRFERTEAPVLAMPSLLVIGRDLVLTGNARLEFLDLFDTLAAVGRDAYVTGHPALRVVSRSPAPTPSIGGALAWAANGVDPCDLPALMAWALGRARAVLFAASSDSEETACPD
ncbi:MAG: hypothetical protein AAF602_31195, partial [Myxococcota bacterium]